MVFGYPFFVAMTYACFPFFILKQTISIVQLLTAVKAIAKHDMMNKVHAGRPWHRFPFPVLPSASARPPSCC